MADLSALQRQRRFLILMSLAVIAFYALGATVNKNAEYSGFGVTLANPGHVVAGLWIVWVWSLWRYAQRVYELWPEVWKTVTSDVEKQDLRIALRAAGKDAQRQARAGELKAGYEEYITVDGPVFISPHLDEVLDDDIGPHELFVQDPDGSRKYRRLQIVLRWGQPEDRTVGTENLDFSMNAAQVRWLRRREWLYAMLGLPAFSEHAAPLLLASVVPFVLLMNFNDEQLGTHDVHYSWCTYPDSNLTATHGDYHDLNLVANPHRLPDATR